MRAYTVAATAVALNVSKKWLDNVLSHNRVPGVSQRAQGYSRRLTPQAVLILEIAGRLIRTLQIPLAPALELASRLATNPGIDSVDVGEALTLSLDVGAVLRHVTTRLSHAVEVAPSPRRGRPPAG